MERGKRGSKWVIFGVRLCVCLFYDPRILVLYSLH